MKRLCVLLFTLGLFTTSLTAQKADAKTDKIFSLVDLSNSKNSKEAKEKFQANRKALTSAGVLSQDDMKRITQRVRTVMNGKSEKQLIRFYDMSVKKMDRAQLNLLIAGLNAIAEDNGSDEQVVAQSQSGDVDWVAAGAIIGGGIGAAVGLVVGILDVVPGDEGAWVAAGTAAGAAGGAAAGAAIETLGGGEDESGPKK